MITPNEPPPKSLQDRVQAAQKSDALTAEEKRELAYLHGFARMLDATVAQMLDDLGIP